MKTKKSETNKGSVEATRNNFAGAELFGDASENLALRRAKVTAKCDEPITGVILGVTRETVSKKLHDHLVILLLAPTLAAVDDEINDVPAGTEVSLLADGGLAKLRDLVMERGPIGVGRLRKVGQKDLKGGHRVNVWTSDACQVVGSMKLTPETREKVAIAHKGLAASYLRALAHERKASAAVESAEKSVDDEDEQLPF